VVVGHVWWSREEYLNIEKKSLRCKMKPVIGERGRKSQTPRQEENKKEKRKRKERKQMTHSQSQHACVIASCTMKSIERERSIELITKHWKSNWELVFGINDPVQMFNAIFLKMKIKIQP